MEKLIDFNCTYDNSVGISKEVTQKLDLKFPDAYLNWDSMVQICLALKDHEQADFCLLPFCHTLEGEAMGGIINYGDAAAGPRAKDYICTTAEELLALPSIDYSSGRISEVLTACRRLREQGENVVLMLSGPFTILNVLIDARYAFKILRKQPEKMIRILDKFQEELLTFADKAQEAGVNLICYADSSGGLNILGPKNTEFMVRHFTYPFLKELEKRLDPKHLILLCPKTTFALLGTGKAAWKDIALSGPLSYGQACMEAIGKTKFAGQMCIKNIGYRLDNGILKSLELL